MTDQSPDQDLPDQEPPKLQLKPLEIGAGAGAAVITAFASSALGVAGTVGGAAVASVLTTVSGTLLRHSAHRTTLTLRRYRPAVPLGLGASRGGAGGAEQAGQDADRGARLATGLADRPGPTYLAGGVGWPEEPGPGEPDLGGPAPSGTTWGEVAHPARTSGPGILDLPDDPAGADRSDGPGGPGGRGGPGGARRGRPRWLLFVGATAAVFVLAMLGITGLEAAIGRPLSSLFGHGGDGRSSVQQVFGGHAKATPTPTSPGGTAPAGSGQSAGAGQSPTPAQPPGQSQQPPATSQAPADPPASAAPGGAGDQGGAGATP